MEFDAKEIARYVSASVYQMQERDPESSKWFGILQELIYYVRDEGKAPDIYIMFRDDDREDTYSPGFEDMLDIVKELFADPDGLIFQDLDAKAFDIQIAECMAPDLPEAFCDDDDDVLDLFTLYEGANHATFLYLSLNDHYS